MGHAHSNCNPRRLLHSNSRRLQNDCKPSFITGQLSTIKNRHSICTEITACEKLAK